MKSKKAQIEEFLQVPIKAGDDVKVKGHGSRDVNHWGLTKVKEVFADGSIKVYESDNLIHPQDYKKWTGLVGHNPFPVKKDRVENINFTLESILFQLGLGRDSREEKYEVEGITVQNLNWNPFVYNSAGEKQYYQRPFVWDLKDKQLFLESIYNNIDCGKVLIRKRSWEELRQQVKNGEKELFWNDVVDSKQRLNAIHGFINNEYPDFNGMHYEDLSDMAKRQLTNHQLFSYSLLPENSEDKDVIEQFLKLNFTGKPQSEQHINFVKEINKQL